MEKEYFLDTTRILEHIEILSSEKHTAQKLKDSIVLMKNVVLNTSNPNYDILHKFRQIIDDVDGLCRYFEANENLFDNTAVEANIIIQKISLMLEDNLFDSKKVIDIDTSNIL